MKDELNDVEWLLRMLERAELHARSLPSDIETQDGLRLTGTVMRLDRIRESLDQAWRTLQLMYDAALERDRVLDANRTVSEPSDSGAGVVADILRAAATGLYERGSSLDSGCDSAADVA